MSQFVRIAKWILAAWVFIMVSGCASQSAVLKENRDTSETFDGRWRVNAQGREGIQFASATNVRCNKLDWNTILKIDDGKGEADLGYGAYNIPFFIGADGGFRVSIETDQKWSDDENIVVSLEGSLSAQNGKGVYSISYGGSYAGGCRYKAKFVKSRS